MGVKKKNLHYEIVYLLECLLLNENMTDMQSYYIKPFFMTWCKFMGLLCMWETWVLFCADALEGVNKYIIWNEQKMCSKGTQLQTLGKLDLKVPRKERRILLDTEKVKKVWGFWVNRHEGDDVH